MAVYFIRAGEDGPVKIGSAVNVTVRLAELQVGNHMPLTVLRTVDGGPAEEDWLHEKFANNHIRGEWFTFCGEMLTVAVPALPARIILSHLPWPAWPLIEQIAAEHLSINNESIRKWRERGRVPHRWRLPIMEAARAKRVKLDSAIFDNVPQPDDEASEETQPVDSHREGQRRSAALALNPETRRSARQ